MQFKQEVLKHPSIQSVSFSTGIPALKQFHMRDFQREDQAEGKGIQWYQADEDFQASLGLEVVAGRWFSTSFATDTASIVLNEAAVRHLGFGNPIDHYLIKNKGMPDEQKLRIVGVIRDFHFESFSAEH